MFTQGCEVFVCFGAIIDLLKRSHTKLWKRFGALERYITFATFQMLPFRENQRGPQGIVGEHGPLLIIMMIKEK